MWRIADLPGALGDARLLRSVFTNLLANAVKYTRLPRRQAVVEVGHLAEANEDVYFVRDNGVGFDMAYVDKLFGVFSAAPQRRGIPGHRHWAGERPPGDRQARRPGLGNSRRRSGCHVLLRASATAGLELTMRALRSILLAEDDPRGRRADARGAGEPQPRQRRHHRQ